MRDIGRNIKELRRAQKLTQEELGERRFSLIQTLTNCE